LVADIIFTFSLTHWRLMDFKSKEKESTLG